MDKLEALASITRISENVVRVLGQNPGKYTLQGTNTYIIGKTNPYILVDTAQGLPEYIPVLESALRDTAPLLDPTKPHISDIIISHWHHDHVGGLPAVLALLRHLWDSESQSDSESRSRARTPFCPPRLHKFPLPAAATLISHSHVTLPSIIDSLPPADFTPSPSGAPFHDLSDGQTLDAMGMRVLHTPGHTVDSICLYIPADRALYTADTVLGQGTAVFEDLSTYIASLRKMLEYRDPNADSTEAGGTATVTYDVLYPGHGPVVQAGKDAISVYIRHRMEREAQIVGILRESSVGASDPWTTWTLVSRIYASYPESLWLPAARGVDLHLKKLEVDGKVTKLDGEGVETKWVWNEKSTL